MTKVAAMPIYGKNLKKSSSPEPIDRWPGYYQEYTNDDLGLTLTFFTARSNMGKC